MDKNADIETAVRRILYYMKEMNNYFQATDLIREKSKHTTPDNPKTLFGWTFTGDVDIKEGLLKYAMLAMIVGEIDSLRTVLCDTVFDLRDEVIKLRRQIKRWRKEVRDGK